MVVGPGVLTILLAPGAQPFSLALVAATTFALPQEKSRHDRTAHIEHHRSDSGVGAELSDSTACPGVRHLATRADDFRHQPPIRVPRIGATTASFDGEGETISLGDAAFDEVDMLPSTLQSVKAIIPISAELVRSAVMGVTTVLEQRVVQDVALAIDKAFIQGSGTAGTNIIGLVNQSGITTQTYAASGAGSLQDQDTYLSLWPLRRVIHHAHALAVQPCRLVRQRHSG